MRDSRTSRDCASVERGILHGADWPRVFDEMDEWSKDEDATL